MPRPIKPAGFDYKNDEKDEDLLVWSTEKVNRLLEKMDDGYQPKSHPFHSGDINLKKGNIVFEYTEHELKEIKKCANDIVYFANNYCTVMTDEGLQRIKLRGYQEKLLRHLVNNRFNIVLASRQVGKTICSSIYIAWYSLFNFDKNALVLANKGTTTKEIVDKGKVILTFLPFFMKPGILKWDVYTSKFDNGCRIQGDTTTKKAAIGFTIHLLFMDEFAHIQNDIVESFYENVYPTVSASKNSQIIITSTPNGYNKFYEIYKAAVNKENVYSPFRIDWWDVPGRDEAWMKQEVANLGSEEAFQRQYGNQFISASSLLLGPASISKLEKGQIDFEHREIPELDDIELDYKDFLWHPGFDFDEIEDGFFVYSIDIAEGDGGDNSVINLFQVDVLDVKDFDKIVSPSSFIDFFRLKQIGRFRTNELSVEEFAKALYVIGFDLFNPDNIKMIIEWNMFGAEAKKNLETCFPGRNDFDEEVVVKFKHRIDAKAKKFGLKIKNDNKPIFCQNFKKYISQNKIEITDRSTITEAVTFGKLKNGTWGGQLGNDDLMMSCVNVSEIFNTIDFTEFVEDLYDTLDEKIHLKIDEILENSGDDGTLNYDIYDLV